MNFKIVVAGYRYYNNYEKAKEFIDSCVFDLRNKYNLIFVSGGCKGADMLGERYALENGYKIERHIADWAIKPAPKEIKKWHKLQIL